ncbi:MAG TPA: hypothetical protein VK892_23330 [Pyrinomonadaceae bacterium]|nr:hypothetical protein [Pyrinomonadaceae bacterium]
MAAPVQTTGMMTALFRTREDAENAYQALLDRGYTRDDISILMTEESRTRYYGENYTTDDETELGSKALEGTGAGAGIGGTVGAIIGAIAAIGTSVVIPGLGLIVAGPLAAALAGAGAGGITGGLIGALIGSGIPEETAKHYEAGLKEGGIVLGFRPKTTGEADEVAEVWNRYNGEMVFR